MSRQTGIQWTDITWNPTVGCTRVSPGCDHCYAFDFHDRRMYAPYIQAKRAGREVKVAPQFHQPFSRVQLMPERLEAPLHWRKPRRVFVNSVSDLFHDAVPDEFIEQVFGVMARTPQHTYQVLTKRPARMLDWMRRRTNAHALRMLGEREYMQVWPLPNVWLGVSVENQAAADERIPLLLQTPAAVRFLSCEPLLGPISRLHRRRGFIYTADVRPADDALDRGIHWVIIGGESGPHARVMNPAWAESLVEQCREAGVSVFMKQLGSKLAYQFSLKDRHGGVMEQWPLECSELRVREFPQIGGARAQEAAVTP